MSKTSSSPTLPTGWQPSSTERVYPWTGRKFIFFGGSLVVLIMGASMISSAGDDTPKVRDYGDHNSAIEACHQMTEDRLKSPATAEFPYYDDAGVTATQIGDAWSVESFVDSENSFGANIRMSFICGVSLTGSTWTLDAWAQT